MSLMTTTHVAEWANRNAAAGEQYSVWASETVTPVLATPAAAAAVSAARVTAATAALTGAVSAARATAVVTGYSPDAELPSRKAPEGASFSALLNVA